MKPGVRKPARFIRDLLRASSWKQSRIGRAAALLILIGSSTSAFAEERRERLTLEYQAPDSCPGAERFVSEVADLTQKAQFASDDALPIDRELSITISAAGAGFSGVIRLEDETGTSRREIDGESCEEVVGALALAFALAVDPDALGGEPTPTGPEPVVLKEEPLETPSTKPEIREKPTVRSSGTQKGSTKMDRASFEEAGTHLILGAGFQSGFWFVRVQNDSGELVQESHGRLQGRLSVELETKELGFWTSYGLDVGAAWANTEPLSFRWLPIIRAQVCPLWIRSSERVRLGACVGGSFAPLYAPPGDFLQAQAVTINYTGIDTVLRLQFGSGSFRAELQAGVEVPLMTRTYATQNVTDGSENIVLELDHTPIPTLGFAVGWEIF